MNIESLVTVKRSGFHIIALNIFHLLPIKVKSTPYNFKGKESRVNRLIEDCERYRSTVKKMKSQDLDKVKDDRKEQDR
jgi:hypothetical protein